MRARFVCLVLLVPLLATGLTESPFADASEVGGAMKAGVGVADATFHVGASAGQYASLRVEGEDEPAHNLDPYGHSIKNVPSYGIHSRLTARALVVEGPDGTRVALVKNDLYIPQDLLNTRVAQILEEHDRLVSLGLKDGVTTGIGHDNMAIAVSHSHSSPYYSSPSWGVWLFQDVFDIRHFEYLAQQMAAAVIEASENLVPARMGAATSYFDHTQRHSFGPAIADDGSPAGYPKTDNDHSISVLRFDDVSDPERPRPLANFVTLGQHPEFLEGNNLITAEYVGALERMADAETGGVTVFAQNNTGTAEPDRGCEAHACEERAEYSHREYAQAERGARVMADVVVQTFKDIEECSAVLSEPGPCDLRGSELPEEYDRAVVPFRNDYDVAVNDKQFAPPYSHPYPSVSNCRTHEAAAGNPGVPIIGLPDCNRATGGQLKQVMDQIPAPFNPGATYETLREAGIPLPDNYGAPSYTGLQETFQVHLQAIKLGPVLITVCPCEQWSDQSINIKTRADKTQGNMHIGFNWSCGQNADDTWTCNRSPSFVGAPDEAPVTVSDDVYRRMHAQVNNDAAGWDAGFEACSPQVANDGRCPLRAESEPEDPDAIKGNFTQSEFVPAEWLGEPFPAELSEEQGFDLVVPVGMANDYWGYIATYREYQRGDHYRKALTGLGAHSADFLATRLVTMGGALNGGPDFPLNALDRAYEIDGQHQWARAELIGRDAQVHVAAYERTLPPDGGTPAAVEEPQDIKRFDAATFQWIGGSNYTDDPQVTVERREGDRWVPAGDMTGDVVVTVTFPKRDELLQWRAGAFEWHWKAIFEAFNSDIDDGRGNQTPAGTYRFVVEGRHKGLPASEGGEPYEVVSEPFRVEPWNGITVEDLRYSNRQVSFEVGPVNVKDFCSGYPSCGNTRSIAIGPIDYPDTWTTAPLPERPETGDKLFPRLQRMFVDRDGTDHLYCFSCTFRPWADTSEVVEAWLTVVRPGNRIERIPASFRDGRWVADVHLRPPDITYVEAGDIVDSYGEINSSRSATVSGSPG